MILTADITYEIAPPIILFKYIDGDKFMASSFDEPKTAEELEQRWNSFYADIATYSERVKNYI